MGVGAALKFLPQFVWGRGTVRRSRMVEGQSRHRLSCDQAHNRIQIGQDIVCGNAQGMDVRFDKPSVTFSIPFGVVPACMALPIDFNREPCIATIKIKDIRPARMLPTKFQSVRPPAKDLLDKHFRQRHGPAQLPGFAHSACSRLGRPIFQHRATTPPSCFAWSPSPRQARGGFLATLPFHSFPSLLGRGTVRRSRMVERQEGRLP
jgi:hypothetical protein